MNQYAQMNPPSGAPIVHNANMVMAGAPLPQYQPQPQAYYPQPQAQAYPVPNASGITAIGGKYDQLEPTPSNHNNPLNVVHGYEDPTYAAPVEKVYQTSLNEVKVISGYTNEALKSTVDKSKLNNKDLGNILREIEFKHLNTTSPEPIVVSGHIHKFNFYSSTVLDVNKVRMGFLNATIKNISSIIDYGKFVDNGIEFVNEALTDIVNGSFDLSVDSLQEDIITLNKLIKGCPEAYSAELNTLYKSADDFFSTVTVEEINNIVRLGYDVPINCFYNTFSEIQQELLDVIEEVDLPEESLTFKLISNVKNGGNSIIFIDINNVYLVRHNKISKVHTF